MSDSVTPWAAAHQAPLASIISRRLLRFMSIESVMKAHHIICCPPFLLPSIFPSSRIFSNELSLHIKWSIRVLELQLQHQSFQSGLISFRIDWFDLFAVQETLKNFLQHHSLKASILQFSAFFMYLLSVVFKILVNKNMKHPN